MADEAHLEILKQGVEAWNRWRKDNPRIVPNLIRAALSRSCLDGVNFREAYLTRADLIKADLSGADLSGANLGGAILTAANLFKADLRGARLGGAFLAAANLFKASLVGADLREANLCEAELEETNLAGAHLAGANLRGTYLYFVNLSNATLSGADFSGAHISYTVFANNDLSAVKGLERVEHQSRSTLGVDTLFNSNGNIPPIFLRGCGLPEDFITYVPSLTGRAIEFYSCFISYSHADRSFARRLHDALQGRGIRCWLDEHHLLPGHDIYAEVDRGIRLWDKVLLCCSKDSLTSWWVDNEINSAFDKEQRLMKARGEKVLALVPVDLDGYLFSGEWRNGKAGQVKSRLAADFTGWKRSQKKFEAAFERLVKALRTDGGREPAPPSKL